MLTAELKEKLISGITAIKDEELLQDMYDLMVMENNDKKVYQLTDEQLSVVREAQADIEAGHFYTQEEMDKEFDEWLEK